MNYTSIEQSKKLLELGLKAETADACYDVGYGQTKAHIECENFIGYFTNDEFPELKDRYIPCWSLEVLLELMPKIDNQLPSLRKCENYYCVVYSNIVTRLGDNQWQNGKTPLEAAFNMVVWLLENDYIKTESE